jgi:hypothetical protein
MRVWIEIKAAPGGTEPTKRDMGENIDVLTRLIATTWLSNADQHSLMKTRSILCGLQENMPD